MTSQSAGSVSAGNVIPAIEDVSSYMRGDCCSIQIAMDLIFLGDTLTTPQEEPPSLSEWMFLSAALYWETNCEPKKFRVKEGK